MHLAKRLLKHYPLLLNDIYLSEEYYGENVLHMAAVAEDPSIVKWLLDIGSERGFRDGGLWADHQDCLVTTVILESWWSVTQVG